MIKRAELEHVVDIIRGDSDRSGEHIVVPGDVAIQAAQLHPGASRFLGTDVVEIPEQVPLPFVFDLHHGVEGVRFLFAVAKRDLELFMWVLVGDRQRAGNFAEIRCPTPNHLGQTGADVVGREMLVAGDLDLSHAEGGHVEHHDTAI